jgi:hypothetical protein
MKLILALLVSLAISSPAFPQGMAAGERARGEGRCPVGTVGEAVPGGYRCVRPGAAAIPAQGTTPQAAGVQAQEVSRGAIAGAWPVALGAAAIIGGAIAAASQGGGSSPSGTR